MELRQNIWSAGTLKCKTYEPDHPDFAYISTLSPKFVYYLFLSEKLECTKSCLFCIDTLQFLIKQKAPAINIQIKYHVVGIQPTRSLVNSEYVDQITCVDFGRVTNENLCQTTGKHLGLTNSKCFDQSNCKIIGKAIAEYFTMPLVKMLAKPPLSMLVESIGKLLTKAVFKDA